MIEVVIGLGANLERPEQAIAEAVDRIGQLNGVELTAVSSNHRSSPVGPEGQAEYVNAALAAHTSVSAAELLVLLHEIEKKMGRIRRQHWGARTIDLDLLAYGSERIFRSDLRVPHPWMLVRRFALMPAAEVSNMCHPVLERPLPELAECLVRPIVHVASPDETGGLLAQEAAKLDGEWAFHDDVGNGSVSPDDATADRRGSVLTSGAAPSRPDQVAALIVLDDPQEVVMNERSWGGRLVREARLPFVALGHWNAAAKNSRDATERFDAVRSIQYAMQSIRG